MASGGMIYTTNFMMTVSTSFGKVQVAWYTYKPIFIKIGMGRTSSIKVFPQQF
jgi:hypothetical protein